MTQTAAEAPNGAGAGDARPTTEHVGRPRTVTTTAEIDSTINHPGSVRINVKGAFIVDQNASSPTAAQFSGRASPDHHQPQDIRLPNHTAVVSHIAIDVSPACRLLLRAYPLRRLAFCDALALTVCALCFFRLAALLPSSFTSRERPSLPNPGGASISLHLRQTASTTALLSCATSRSTNKLSMAPNQAS